MIKSTKAVSFVIVLHALCAGTMLHGEEESSIIRIDIGHTTKADLRIGAAGANLCWLLDSDRGQQRSTSMSKAIDELGCGSLRFPYGHLADNYLWHTAPFNDTAGGLRPTIATSSQAPGEWEWAVEPDGSFRSAMDFDEYMSLCDRLAIKPLVVINALSWKYKNGPSYEQLRQTAVEWVKYAKQKHYKVAYWQIGNEVDHHHDLLSQEQYVKLYVDFASAMKEVDPTIRTGPGILSSTGYFKSIVSQAPNLIDFVSCHQYMYPYQNDCANYSLWKNCTDRFVRNIQRMQVAVSESSKPAMEILVTESGVSPSNDKLGKINNTYKALWWAEVLMNLLTTKNVSYVYYWGTHSPWGGPQDNDDEDVSVLLRVDDNSRKPTGEILRIVNSNLLDRMVDAPRVSGTVRTYATTNHSGTKLNLFLLNKNDDAEQVTVKLKNDFAESRLFDRMVFSGESPEDRSPKIDKQATISERANTIQLRLPPLSITVLRQLN
ncbi:alpha-L-arabinofuranosidase [Rhodopirellula sp. SWK7]|uniref:alpha-L-arabinofuranosidase n=1 Tax=Rhodopirellula sp. SWK7 TaxID=595460 RepID=UPI0002C03D3E|nr:alpha-L-arabinofuranosidase [Rhodopirellula sp. SWK7]EMI41985.1 Alpha-L-arabinofuranosidase-like protein [Rhodopirellula sp. SWK7]